MAYLGDTTFQRNRKFLLGGDEGFDLSGDTRTPEYDLSDDFREAPKVGSQGARAPSSFGGLDSWSRGGDFRPSTPAAPTSSSTQPNTQPSEESAQPGEAPPVPSLASFYRQGSLEERLFTPAEEAAAGGEEALTGASELFKREAGPSRSYESVGAERTLADAYKGGRAPDMEAARDLVGAKYTGPQGLDTNAVAGLQKLTQDLRTRQRALSSSGGLQTLIGGSVVGLTPGQARFEARRELPESKLRARDLGFETIAPLESRLGSERQAALDFANMRTGEEADIAARSRGFLEGERGGISADIERLIDERLGQQQGAAEAFAGIRGAADPYARLEAIRAASPYLVAPELEEGAVDVSDDIRLPPGTFDMSNDIRRPTSGSELAELFNTQAMQDKAAADALFKEIMARPEYAAIAGYDPLELGVSARGKHFYDAPDEEGNLRDLRRIEKDPAMRQLLYERQQELEAAFDPARGQRRAFSRTPQEESRYADLKPLYHGEEFSPLDQTQYFGFDPGVMPSRQNTSTTQQREQFNRINDLLGEMDRIAEAGDPYRAAQIFANAEKYLADEEAGIAANKENQSEAAKQWAGQVKKLRKKYRKAKREKEYAQIGAVIGTVVGTYTPLAAIGGSYWGGIAGQEIGKSLA